MGVLNSEASEEGEIKGKRRNKYLLEGKVRQRMLSGHPPQRREALPEISSYRHDSVTAEMGRWCRNVRPGGRELRARQTEPRLEQDRKSQPRVLAF